MHERGGEDGKWELTPPPHTATATKTDVGPGAGAAHVRPLGHRRRPPLPLRRHAQAPPPAGLPQAGEWMDDAAVRFAVGVATGGRKETHIHTFTHTHIHVTPTPTPTPSHNTTHTHRFSRGRTSASCTGVSRTSCTKFKKRREVACDVGKRGVLRGGGDGFARGCVSCVCSSYARRGEAEAATKAAHSE